MTSNTTADTTSQVLSSLEGGDCPYCIPGTLKTGDYKGNSAIICSNCGTPTAQMFGDDEP